ncbi:YcaO-like family protein [Streptomyces sp. NPDC004561]
MLPLDVRVQAFNHCRDTSRLVDFDAPAPDLDQLRTRVAAAGLRAEVRYTASEFGLPYVQGFIMEPTDDDPIAISVGSGLHPIKEIAAVRALAEAAQSRLSYTPGRPVRPWGGSRLALRLNSSMSRSSGRP